MEAWLARLDPVVIDRWLLFASIEPDAFRDGRRDTDTGTKRGEQHLVDAETAGKRLASMFG